MDSPKPLTLLASYLATATLLTQPAHARRAPRLSNHHADASRHDASAPLRVVRSAKPGNIIIPSSAAANSVRAPSQRLERRPRHFPLWAELSGLGLGVASIIGGSISYALHGTLGLDKEAKRDNKLIGPAFIFTGIPLVSVSAIFLIIDESVRRHRPRAR